MAISTFSCNLINAFTHLNTFNETKRVTKFTAELYNIFAENHHIIYDVTSIYQRHVTLHWAECENVASKERFAIQQSHCD